jgi:hypothetical protein
LLNVVCGSHIFLEVECDFDEKKSSVCGLQLVLCLLAVLKRLMDLWELGSESSLPGFRMGITLADFQPQGKYQNLRI